MAWLTWDDQWSLGVGFMDEEHRNLVDALDRLLDQVEQDPNSPAVGSLLAFLGEYARLHFDHEEADMERLGYPGFHAHRAIHHLLLRQLEGLCERHAQGTLNLQGRSLDFLQSWLIDHILGEDATFARYRKLR